jgi:hypothetical protein
MKNQKLILIGLVVCSLTFAQKAKPTAKAKPSSGKSVTAPAEKIIDDKSNDESQEPSDMSGATTPSDAGKAAPSEEVAKPVVQEQEDSGTGRYNVFALGMAKPTKSFVLKNSLAVAYDFFYGIPKTDFNFRAGFWGFTSSQEDAGFKYTYSVLNLDLGLDYFILNGNFKLGVGGRLGYAIPFATIKYQGLEYPFSGKGAFTPAVSVSSYYRFNGYMVGAETRAAFYSESKMGVPTHIFVLLAFGKEF